MDHVQPNRYFPFEKKVQLVSVLLQRAFAGNNVFRKDNFEAAAGFHLFLKCKMVITMYNVPPF